MLNTAILFIVFNRPETTRQVFEAIRKAQPKQLFVAADGPRPEKVGERERCEESRRIATSVDWDCQVKTLFRSENRGCGLGPSEAITWFFNEVEQGIILEDDCLPNLAFFKFCNDLLFYYKENERVMHISGSNIQQGIIRNKSSYYFSRIPHMWGWAAWRRSWEKYTYNPSFDFQGNLYKEQYWKTIYDKICSGELKTVWDYQWVFTILKNDGLAITPNVNMIKNIGFEEGATHVKQPPFWYQNIQLGSIKSISHPGVIHQNENADKFLMDLLSCDLSICDRVRIKLAALKNYLP